MSSRPERPDLFFRAAFWRAGPRSGGISPLPFSSVLLRSSATLSLFRRCLWLLLSLLSSASHRPTHELEAAAPSVCEGGRLRADATAALHFARGFSRIPGFWPMAPEDSGCHVSVKPPHLLSTFRKGGANKKTISHPRPSSKLRHFSPASRSSRLPAAGGSGVTRPFFFAPSRGASGLSSFCHPDRSEPVVPSARFLRAGSRSGGIVARSRVAQVPVLRPPSSLADAWVLGSSSLCESLRSQRQRLPRPGRGVIFLSPACPERFSRRVSFLSDTRCPKCTLLAPFSPRAKSYFHPYVLLRWIDPSPVRTTIGNPPPFIFPLILDELSAPSTVTGNPRLMCPSCVLTSRFA